MISRLEKNQVPGITYENGNVEGVTRGDKYFYYDHVINSALDIPQKQKDILQNLIG